MHLVRHPVDQGPECLFSYALSEGLLEVLFWNECQRIGQTIKAMFRQVVIDVRQVPLEGVGVKEVSEGIWAERHYTLQPTEGAGDTSFGLQIVVGHP